MTTDVTFLVVVARKLCWNVWPSVGEAHQHYVRRMGVKEIWGQRHLLCENLACILMDFNKHQEETWS